jgi:hypothetical protein
MKAKSDVIKHNAYFSVDSKGQLTFTVQGIKEYRSYFGKAGIDIRNIKALDDFRRARCIAAPFFKERLINRVKRRRLTLERRLLIAVAEGNDEQVNRIQAFLTQK